MDGAIHRVAGDKLYDACKTLRGCETGEAKITKGYNLNANYVIHTVGPVWNGGKYGEEEKLAECYRNSLKIAVKNKIKSIAFPSISTGAYRFPVEKAIKIAVKEVKNFLKQDKTIEKVVFVCFDDFTYALYLEELRNEKLI